MKTVLITGGAKGIGEAVVRELALDEYNVVIGYNTSEQKAFDLQKELKENGCSVEIFKADIGNKEEIKDLVNYTVRKFGNIDILINNAGISQIKVFTDITDEDWENMININLSAPFYLTREVLPYMINKKNGCIINISSIWGMVGSSCEVHYSAAKAGLIGMTKALAKEVGPSNIRVNAVAPGAILTDMNSDITEKDWEDFNQNVPLGKVGQPVDIAKCVKMLIENEYITGQVISPNGGYVI